MDVPISLQLMPELKVHELDMILVLYSQEDHGPLAHYHESEFHDLGSAIA